MKRILSLLIISVSINISCTNTNREKIFKDIMPNLLDRITSEYDTKNKNMILLNRYPNIGLSQLLKTSVNDTNFSSFQLELIKGLSNIRNDSVKLEFIDMLKTPRGLTLVTSKKNIDNITSEVTNIFGVINISQICLDKNKENGVLYCFYGCGSKCGKGYFIFIKKDINQIWKVDELFLVSEARW